jgi:hypothetical protein
MNTVNATLFFMYYPLLDVVLLLRHVSVQFSNHLGRAVAQFVEALQAGRSQVQFLMG